MKYKLFKYKVDSDSNGKYLEIHDDCLSQFTRMYYEAIDEKLIENMPDSILIDLKDRLELELIKRCNI